MASFEKVVIKATDPKLKVFSYLPGSVLLHKIALLNKSIRATLPKSRVLDQIIIITVRKELTNAGEVLFPANSFIYAVSLADCFQVQVDLKTIPYMEKLTKMIEVTSKALKLRFVP